MLSVKSNSFFNNFQILNFFKSNSFVFRFIIQFPKSIDEEYWELLEKILPDQGTEMCSMLEYGDIWSRKYNLPVVRSIKSNDATKTSQYHNPPHSLQIGLLAVIITACCTYNCEWPDWNAVSKSPKAYKQQYWKALILQLLGRY